MKKLNVRVILILVLVLTMALSLVACDNDKEPDPDLTPTPSTSKTENIENYFNNLWTLTSGIGGQSISKNEDLAIGLDLGVTLDTVDTGNKVYQTVSLGVAVNAVLDRSSANSSKNTAFKIQIYDLNNKENWVTVYYFFSDADNIYLDFAGKNIVVPFNFETSSGFSTADFSKFFYNWINVDKFSEGALANKSIADVIAVFTDAFGANWTLNTLVDGVTTLFNLNLEELLYPTEEGAMDIGAMLEQYLNIGHDDLFQNGELDIKSVLTNPTVAGVLFDNNKTTVTEDGGHTQLKSTIIGTIAGFVNLGDLLTKNTIITLDYGVKDNAIDGFDIALTMKDISAKYNGNTVNPRATISINDLSIGKASKDGLEMATSKDNYTSDIAVDASVVLDLTGISVDLTAFDKQGDTANPDGGTYTRFSELAKVDGFAGITNLKLNGKLEIGVKGKVDIASRPDKDAADTNETEIEAWLKYADQEVVRLTFVGDRVAFSVNHDAKVDGISIIDLLVRCWGDVGYDAIVGLFKNEAGEFKDAKSEALVAQFAGEFFADDTHLLVNKDFKGGVWADINLGKNFNDLVNKAITKLGITLPTKSDATTQASKEDSTVKKVMNTVGAILPLINTSGNKLTIDLTDTVGKTVASIGKIWDSDMAKEINFIQSIILADRSDMLSVVTRAIKIEGTTYATDEALAAYKADAKTIQRLRDGELSYYKELLVAQELESYKERVIAAIEIDADTLKAAKEDAQYKGKTDAEIKKALQEAAYVKMGQNEIIEAVKKLDSTIVLKYAGKTDDEMKKILTEQSIDGVSIRFLDKTDDQIVAATKQSVLFLQDLFASMASVEFDLGNNGVNLSLDVDVNESAGVGFAINFGVSALSEIEEIGADVTETGNGWFFYSFATK